MKKYLYYLLIAMTVAYSSNGVIAAEKLTIMGISIPPYIMVDENNNINGITVNKIKTTLDKANIPYDIKLTSWKRVLRTLKNNSNVAGLNLSYTKQRAKDYILLTKLVEVKSRLYTLNTLKHQAITLDDIRAGRFIAGCLSQTIRCQELEELGVPEDKTLKISDNKTSKIVDLLLKGRIDFLIEGEDTITWIMTDLKQPLTKIYATNLAVNTQSGYLAISRSTPEAFVQKLRDAFDKHLPK